MARPGETGEHLVTPEVLVVGSVSRDVTVTVDRFPAPGETVVGHSVSYGLGGKGANQAVASALTGVPTSFLGCVGTDEAGRGLLSTLRERGVITEHTTTVSGDSGSAHITVDADGENSISIVPAANRSVTPDVVASARDRDFDGASVVVAQGEIPVGTLEELGRAVAASGVRFVLNLAPAVEVSAECLAAADVLMVNQSEAEAIMRRHGLSSVEGRASFAEGAAGSGAPVAAGASEPAGASVAEAVSESAGDSEPVGAAQSAGASVAERLTEIVRCAVVTLGDSGSVVAVRADETPGPAIIRRIDAARVEPVVDTTGAGDAYAGVFSAALARRLRGIDADGSDGGDIDGGGFRSGDPLPAEIVASCAAIASREAAKVVGAAGASSSYSSFSVEEQ
ncbi:ribokinase [Rothia koreensis]|uniref:ribokinase n=1 Tax=Rothia koreensis TaxID=592378 RepID=UPI003F285A79